VIFLHIGKTGGITLRTILHRHFPSSQVLVVRTADREPSQLRLRREASLTHFASLPQSTREEARLIEGHVIFGLHEFVPRPSNYITLLRDPVALIVSQFHFVARRPRHRLHREVASSGMTLDAYVRSGISLETDNSQTRALSGDTSTPFGECSEEMLEVAKANVREHFPVVGLTERFDETLLLLRRTFGWSKLWYVQANVASRGERSPIAPDTLRWMEQQNRFDVELYRWASDRFEEAIASVPAFEEALQKLRRTNALYRPLGQIVHTIPSRMKDRWRGRGTATDSTG
jgi:hypothetical protein